MLHFILPLAVVAFFIYNIGQAIYNLYFHPLAKFPGHKLWIAFPFLRYIRDMQGTSQHEIFRLHEKYGDVVRSSDSELTFTTADAWRDIYGHGHSLPKVDRREVGTPPEIIASNNADHTRFRKAISHGFSEKGLRAQEPLINDIVDQLMEGLHEEAEAGRPLNMTMWYNLTTFDVISELAWGKSLNSLKGKAYNEYITSLFAFLHSGVEIYTRRVFPTTWALTIGLFYNKTLNNIRARFRKASAESALDRAYDTEKAGRGDLMDSMMRHRGGKDGLTDTEIASNAVVLMVAGSETTATLLSGITYQLGKNPAALKKVTDEVRSAFTSIDEIDFLSATQKLPYMLACLDEALRIYPPVPGVVTHRSPEVTTEISGYTVPAGTRTGVHQISAYWSERNFHQAREYHPERWLAEAATDPSSPFYNDNRAVWQPFSFGPRNCIGRNLAYNEMRLILAKILFTFDLELLPESNTWTDQKIRILWCKHPLMCKLHLRKAE